MSTSVSAAVREALSAERSVLIEEMVAVLSGEIRPHPSLTPERRELLVSQLVDVLLGALAEHRPESARAWGAGEDGGVQEQGATFMSVLSVTRAARRVFARKAREVAPAEEAFAALERVDAVCDDLLDAMAASFHAGFERTRAALGVIRARNADLLQRAPVMTYTTDRELRILAVSDRWLAVLGYARAEVLGRRSLEFATEATRQRAMEHYAPLFLRQGYLDNVPVQFVKRSGEVVDALFSCVGLRSEQGEVERLVAVLVDVTERLRAERELRESEERYRAIVDFAPVAILIHRDDRILFVNPAAAQMLGAPEPAALLGLPGEGIVAPARLPEAREGVERMLSSDGRSDPHEARFRRLDGSTFLGEVVARVIAFEGAPATQVLFTDITTRKEAEEALQRSQAQAQVIAAQEEALRALSAPLIPLGDGVVAMPLIGRITEQRAGRLVEALVEGVGAQAARVAILDVTGVPDADMGVAAALGRAARAIGLLGAEVVLTGMQPALAQALVEIGVDLGGIATRGTLRDGIAYALARAQSQAGAGRARAWR